MQGAQRGERGGATCAASQLAEKELPGAEVARDDLGLAEEVLGELEAQRGHV